MLLRPESIHDNTMKLPNQTSKQQLSNRLSQKKMLQI